MESKTDSEIESIGVMNDDLIDVLAKLVEYERTRGAHGSNERLALVGDGPNKHAMRTAESNVVEDTVLYASELVEDGEVVNTVEIDGDEVSVTVL